MRKTITALILPCLAACSATGLSDSDKQLIQRVREDRIWVAQERAELTSKEALLQSVMTQEQVEAARVRYSLLELTVKEYEVRGLSPAELRAEMDDIVARVQSSFTAIETLGLRMGDAEQRLTLVEDGVLLNRTDIDSFQRAAAEALEAFYLERRLRELEESGEEVSS